MTKESTPKHGIKEIEALQAEGGAIAFLGAVEAAGAALGGMVAKEVSDTPRPEDFISILKPPRNGPER